MVVAYVASRFPEVTETFILRELDAVASDPRIECELLSLFPASTQTVHPAAVPWVDALRRPRPMGVLGAVVWWFARAPVRFLGVLVRVTAGYSRQPGFLWRALVTVAVAAAHARSLRNGRVDHIHAHFATYPLLTAWICHRLVGIPYSVTPHAHDIFVDQSFLRQRLAEARFIVAISDFNRGFLAAYGAGRTTRVHVVRYGIDLSAYSFRPRAPRPTGPVHALCVASLKDYKGHPVLLRALAEGPAELDRVHLDLVGEGPLRSELEQLAHSLGLAERVHFHGGLPEHEVSAMLDRTDMFVLPSVITANGTMEGLPNVLIEALAAGVPAVTTNISGIPELIRDGETGLLAEQGDSADLGRAIAEVLGDPTAARRRAEAGRSLVERNHDLGRNATALADTFCRYGVKRGASK
jgi:colanic acid/amylovoran biosynthesis glycosyltransferase